MFDFFRIKKTQDSEAIPRATARSGFFSTDGVLPYDRMASDAMQISALTKRVFQRNEKHLTAIDEKGNQIAFDEAYPDLQLSKMQNNLFGFLPLPLMSWYASQSFIGYQTAAMIAQNWLVDKACYMPAKDAVRHGYEITTTDGSEIDPEVLTYIHKLDRKFKLKKHCTEFLHMGRVFGIRIALFDVVSADPKYYEKPFNIDGVTKGSYKGISQIDPYWITPELDSDSAANPASQHFYEPTWWRVNGRRVHRTHLVIFKNGEVADILKPTYFYGGIPVPQKIAERVFAAERTGNEAPQLAMTKRLTVLKMDIAEAMANLNAFHAKMQQWTEIMNNFGIKIVGDGEEIEQYDTALADLDEVIMTQYQLVSAASDVPATKLLGTSPKGFGASGDYEQDSYHEFLESLQEEALTPFVQRHHELLIQSDVRHKFSEDNLNIEIVWKPTDTPTAKEQAEINLIKSQRDNQLVQAGAIDGTDVRERIVKDADSDYNGIAEIVPGGPGDRDAAMEAEGPLEQATQASNKEKSQGE